MISNIAKITVYVKNSAEAKKFWTENMGFVIREEQLMGPGMTWLETAPDYHAQNGVIVDDIQKYPYGRMFSFYDQDHQVYLLREA